MRIRIRRILIPVFYCLAIACLIEVPLGQTDLFGEAVILWDTLFRAILAVPVLYYFYQEDAVFRGEKRWDLRAFFLSFGAGAGLSALSFFLMRAAGVSAMEEAGKTLFTGELWLQLLVLLIASPLLEEFFFRGVLYGRLKELLSVPGAAVVSSAFFGLCLGNWLQGIYGFFMGLFLSAAMERCRTVKAPVIMHLAANGAALFLNAIANAAVSP